MDERRDLLDYDWAIMTKANEVERVCVLAEECREFELAERLEEFRQRLIVSARALPPRHAMPGPNPGPDVAIVVR